MRKTPILILAGMILALPVSLRAATVAETSDSAILGPRYMEQLLRMETLAAQFPQLVSLVDYGTSVQGRTLRMLIVKKGDAVRRRPAVVMTGATHGNEYLNIEDRLPEEILKRAQRPGPIATYLDRGGAFVMVPIVNPDGYEHRQRENAHGVDLNRDWDLAPAGYKGFKEVESRRLAEALQYLEGRPERLHYKVTVDYHCCIGALLHPWSFSRNKLSNEDAHRHAAIGEPAKRLLGIEYGPTGDVLGYYPVGTTKDYYFHQYGAVSFTFEGRRAKENLYLAQHTAWWEAIVGGLSLEMPIPLFSLRPEPRRRPFVFAD